MKDQDFFQVHSAEGCSLEFLKTIHTDLGVFGNRTDVIFVTSGGIGSTSLIDCDDPDVNYFDYMAPQESE